MKGITVNMTKEKLTDTARTEWIGMVTASLTKAGVHYQDIDDQVQEVFIRFHKYYSEDKGQVSTYIYSCISTTIKEYRRIESGKGGRKRHMIPLYYMSCPNLQAQVEQLSENTLFEQVAEHCDILALHDAVNSLPERQRLVISFLFFENITLREIGKILGISESRVFQIKAEALIKLKTVLDKLNFQMQ